MTKYIRLENVASFSIGIAAAVALNAVTGWWLNSGRGVGTTLAVLWGVAFLLACWRRQGRRERAVSLWAGFLAAMAMLLLSAGAGTIWPLVIVIGAVLTAASVLTGVAAAA